MSRYIALDGTFNLRDLGGARCADGRRVREGLLYRSDALYQLSDNDMHWLEEADIQTVVDFRAPQEAALHPNRLPAHIKTVVLAPHAELAAQASASRGDDAAKVAAMVERAKTEEGRRYFQENLDSMQRQMSAFVTGESGILAFGAFLQLLAQSSSVPLIFHCKGGKDRTGWGAALFYLTVGVPREQILEDYMDTQRYNQARNARRMEQYRRLTDDETVLAYLSSLMQVKPQYLSAALEEVDRLGGVDCYLQQTLGLSSKQRNNMTDFYLEP